MKVLLSVLFFIVLQSSPRAQVTWADDIAQIMYNNCTSCHNPDGIGPFSLLDYQTANTNQSSIAYAVTAGYMPPWVADTSYQRYAHERVLTEIEKNTILEWVNQGAIEGNPANTPPPPVYSNEGFLVQQADLEIQIPTYTSKASPSADDYVCFSLPSGLISDKKIRAFEVIPGNSSIVHHTLVYIDQNASYPTDTTSGSCTGPFSGTLIGGYTPGAVPTVFPSGGNFNLGITIPAGSNIVLAMHYPEGSYGLKDSTKIKFYFYDDAITIREVAADPLIQKWGFTINANTIDTITNTYSNFPVDISVLSVFPHMHLIGKKISTHAVTQANDTIPFARINNWDFDWQEFLFFENIKKLPAGSVIHGMGVYDNTSNNPFNPNSPPINISAGLNTSDEMFLIYFHYLPYLAGDELIDIDSLTLDFLLNDNELANENNFLKVYPNPFNHSTTFNYNLENNSTVSLFVYNMNGKLIDKVINNQEQPSGLHEVNWNIDQQLAPGIYFYSMNINGKISSGKLILLCK